MVSSKDDSATDGDNSAGVQPDISSRAFTDGEKVLAYHGPRIYEAKVQKTEFRKDEWRYFVHYLGWNKNWDEWVNKDRLMKNTEENLQKQQFLDKKQGVDKGSKTGRSSQTKPKASSEVKVEKEDTKSNVAKGKKQKTETGTEKDSISPDKLFKIQIPSTLRKLLVDDHEFVIQQDKLVKLPRSPTVDDILTKYIEYRSKKDSTPTDPVKEIMNGLRSYFDKALPVILLYKKERSQYTEAVKDDVSPSTIYGAEHLLRLFVKLPELLACIIIEEETIVTLQQKLLEFLKFLQKNQNSFFLASYDGTKVSEGGGKAKDKSGHD